MHGLSGLVWSQDINWTYVELLPMRDDKRRAMEDSASQPMDERRLSFAITSHKLNFQFP